MLSKKPFKINDLAARGPRNSIAINMLSKKPFKIKGLAGGAPGPVF